MSFRYAVPVDAAAQREQYTRFLKLYQTQLNHNKEMNYHDKNELRSNDAG